MINGWRTEQWISEEALTSVEFSEYWNDEAREEQKRYWYVVDGDFAKMEQYLRDTGLPQDLERAARAASAEYGRGISGVGIDLAAGTLWAAPYLLKSGRVDLLYCLEYSKHRLFTIGPLVLDHYAVPQDRVALVLGSFYDLKLADGSLDFVFMSQAFHHAHEPGVLLDEVHRVLRPGGIVVIIGEHLVQRSVAGHVAKWAVSRAVPVSVQQSLLGRTLPSVRLLPLTPPKPAADLLMGDHFYTMQEYRDLFSGRFRIRPITNRKSQSLSFVLAKR